MCSNNFAWVSKKLAVQTSPEHFRHFPNIFLFYLFFISLPINYFGCDRETLVLGHLQCDISRFFSSIFHGVFDEKCKTRNRSCLSWIKFRIRAVDIFVDARINVFRVCWFLLTYHIMNAITMLSSAILSVVRFVDIC